MKCRIERSPFSGMAITFYDTDVEGRVRAVLEPVRLTGRTVPVGEIGTVGPRIEPTFEFADRMGDDFLQAIVDAAAELGVKPKTADYQQGKIEALQANLEDLRALLGIMRKETPMTVTGETAMLKARGEYAQTIPREPLPRTTDEPSERRIVFDVGTAVKVNPGGSGGGSGGGSWVPGGVSGASR